MRASAISLAVLSGLGAVLAQTPTLRIPTPTITGGPVSTDLPALVNQLPRCALGCLQTAARQINCNPADFVCLCRSAGDLATQVGGCLFTSQCDSSEIGRAATIAPQICAIVNANPNPAAVASASNLVTSALGAASTPTTKPGAAGRAEVGVGAIVGGAALVAAWAL